MLVGVPSVERKPLGTHDGRVAGQVGQQQVVAAVRRDDVDVHAADDLLHLAHQHRAQAVGAQVLDRGDQLTLPEDVGPRVRGLAHERVVRPSRSQLVEGAQAASADEDARPAAAPAPRTAASIGTSLTPISRSVVERGAVVGRPFFDRRLVLVLVRQLRVVDFEEGLDVADREALDAAGSRATTNGPPSAGYRSGRRPRGSRRRPAAQSSTERAIGPILSMRPRQRHGAVTAHAPERRAQPGRPAARAGRDDAPPRLGADREADAARPPSRGRAGRRAARALLELPRVLRRAAEPDVAPRQLADGGLRDQHGAGRVELLDHRRRDVQDAAP